MEKERERNKEMLDTEEIAIYYYRMNEYVIEKKKRETWILQLTLEQVTSRLCMLIVGCVK